MDDPLIKKLRKYIKDTLDITLVIQPWNDCTNLPFFLRDQSAFYQTEIMTIPCILMMTNDKQETTPAVIRKKIDILRQRTSKAEIIYIRKQLNSFNRKRLVEQKVCFIIPGNQMYLPFLGIDFREHFKKMQFRAETLSPSAQVVLLHSLLKGNQDILRLNDLAERYGYSIMTMSRALSDIESLGLAEITIHGRKREMILKGTKQETWTKALEFLRTPVMKRLYLDQSLTITDGICAGLSALARYSKLAESGNTVWAISSAEGKSLTQKYRAVELSAINPHCNEVEVWNYDPRLFAVEGVVDRLSLFLSLRDEKDERVETAIEQMMKEMTW
jgi:hypothetical protein